MMEPDSMHWTDDEQLLDEYVLRRINPTSLAELESHLAKCDFCRQTVARHQAMVAGIRSAGRRDARRRLAANIERFRIRKEGRWLFLRIAAVVVVAVSGVSVYRAWLAEQQVSSVPVPSGDESAPLPAMPSEGAGAKRTEPAGDQRSKQTDSPAMHDEDLSEVRTKFEQIVPSETGGAAPTTTIENVVPRRIEKDKLQPAMSVAMAEVSVTQVWLEGIEIPAPGRADQKGLAFQENRSQNLRAAKKEKGWKEREGGEEKETGKPLLHSRVFIQQISTGQLQKGGYGDSQRSGVIRSLGEMKGDTIVLYLDMQPPLTSEELGAAGGWLVAADSVIVQVRRRMVGFRLPPGLVQNRAR